MLELTLKQNLDELLPEVIEFNFDELKSELSAFVRRYEGTTLTPETAAQGKADRAGLNRLVAAFDEARKRVKARCLRPYEAFEAKVRELQGIVAPARDAIDAQLKAFEEARREEKRAAITAYFNAHIGGMAEIIGLDRIWDDKWLNATCADGKWQGDMLEKLRNIKSCLDSITMTIPEQYRAEARYEYLRTLNFNATIAYVADRKRQDDAFAAAQEAAAESGPPPGFDADGDTARTAQVGATLSAVTVAAPQPSATVVSAAALSDPEITFTLTFTGRKSALVAMRKFMDANGIRYRKLRVGEEVPGVSAAYPLPTNADEWLRRRAKSLGATDAAPATGRSPWMSNVELWEIKTGRKQRPDISGNPAVERGKAAEPLIRALFALDHPEYEVDYRGAFDVVSRPDEPWYMATLDGRLTERATGALGIFEAKTGALASRMAASAWAGRVPDHYFCQLLHQFNAWPEATFAVLVAYLDDPGPAVGRTHSMRFYRFDRPEVAEDAAFLFDEECRFWRHVETDTEPPLILPAAV